jgi:DNA-binding NarL/FixJ family response regulator
MLAMHSDEGDMLRAFKAGAKACLRKNSAEADRRILATAADRSFVCPAVGEDSDELLTPCKREIRRPVATGKTSKEIANLIRLNLRTAEPHRAKHT